ncbi:carbonic anhydrase 14 [Pimephales promelas]|uniref:carbonic anhydrase 14 n=1 Tax=Pimephales promelas TaxID=90988 RepID=UPI0019557496|nr:carbonic anhydrase 14 [Pimephales promelas]KAG1970956.1 carbonic anhydrase [Pimephales promelas]
MLLLMFLILHLYLQVLVTASSSSSEEDGSSERDDGEHSKGSSHQHQWGYHDQERWLSAFEHCRGKSQSPINIDTRKVFYEPRLPAIQLEGYDLTGSPALTLFNNGHTLQLSLPSSMRIVTGFDHVYVAAQLHFHWGTTADPGSEHTVDKVHFPAEIHVVHYNSKYANLIEAASKADGLAVLGGFIGIGLHENDNYEKILSALKDISKEESNTEIPGFNVRHLLPNSLEGFYRYAGSLTTPPCFQTVSWTLFNDSIRVSRRQLAALEDSLKTEHNKLLSKNFRAPQLLHGRKVLTSFRTASTTGKAREAPRLETHGSGVMKTSGAKWHILAITFGVLFAVTLLVFSMYTYRQKKKYSKFKKDSKQNVIYKPAAKDTDPTSVTVT